MVSVLVTDGEERSALAVVRSLGRAGHRTYVCSSRHHSLAGASRYCLKEALVPSPLHAPDDFLFKIERLVTNWQVDMLVPISEASLLALLPERASFGHICMPFPPHDVFRRICDKAAVRSEAVSVGIAVPDQYSLMTPGDRESIAAADLRFPLVVKPVRSVGEVNGHRTKFSVSHACDWDSLQAILDRNPPAAYPLLIQRRIVGPGIGVFLLIWQSELVASFAHRRIREKPPSGGVSVYRESISVDRGLLERSRRLLERFHWEGVAMVEYKLDEVTDIPYLMEINGRFWGSLQLAIDAGVDFPKLLACLTLGSHPNPVSTYQVGLKSRWWWGDVDHLIARLRRSKETLALPVNAPSRLRAVADFVIAWGPGNRCEVVRLADPRPFLRETLEWLCGDRSP